MATYTTQTRVRKNSGETDVGTRRRVNFIEGANVTLNIVDDGTDGEIDVEIVSAAGGGDVTGPGASVDNAIVRFDGATGKIIQDYTSGAPTIGDSGIMSIGQIQVTSALDLSDTIALRFGVSQDAAILYYTGDANAKHVFFTIDESDDSGNNVPVWAFMEETGAFADHGFFDAVVEATVAVVNNAKDAYVALDSGDINSTSHGLYFKPAADEDVNILKVGVTGTPALIWDESADKLASSVGLNIADDKIVTLGSTEDAAFTLNSAGLTADTALAGVLIGTPDTPALAADSLIIANTTADGDILIAVNDGGASKQMLFLDGSTGITHIGKPGSSGWLATTGDAYFSGNVELDGNVYMDFYAQITSESYGLLIRDNVHCRFGTGLDGCLKYQTNDADAKILVGWIDVSADAANNIPVFFWGEHTGVDDKNFGWFDALTEPGIGVANLAGDAYIMVDAGDVNGSPVGQGLYFKSAVDEDINLISLSVTGVAGPLVVWDESEDRVLFNKGINLVSGAVLKGVGTGANGIVITNPKNAAASALSGTQLDVEIDIGGVPYYFTVYPAKA